MKQCEVCNQAFPFTPFRVRLLCPPQISRDQTSKRPRLHSPPSDQPWLASFTSTYALSHSQFLFLCSFLPSSSHPLFLYSSFQVEILNCNPGSRLVLSRSICSNLECPQNHPVESRVTTFKNMVNAVLAMPVGFRTTFQQTSHRTIFTLNSNLGSIKFQSQASIAIDWV